MKQIWVYHALITFPFCHRHLWGAVPLAQVMSAAELMAPGFRGPLRGCGWGALHGCGWVGNLEYLWWPCTILAAT